jgi:hypothetical protein
MVITRCRPGHGLTRKFVVSCVEVETSKSTAVDRIPCTISALVTVLSIVFRKEEREMGSRRSLWWVLFPGISGSLRIPICADRREIARMPGKCFMLAGLP